MVSSCLSEVPLYGHFRISTTSQGPVIRSLHNFFHIAANCTHGQSRLQNGMNSTSGRVEVCVDGEWHTVCDKQFDSMAAGVFCTSLGLHFNSK